MSLQTPGPDEKTQLESISVIKLTSNATTSPIVANLPLTDWNNPSEKRNPQNWKIPKKIFHTLIPCLIAFEVTFSTSVTVPAAGLIASEFSISHTRSLLPLTLYTLGLALGPLFIAPFSEVVGRRWVYIFTITSLLIFTAAAGVAPTFSALLAFRFLAGFLGSAGMAIGGGSVADLWSLQKVGGTIGPFFILCPFLGPILGPIAGTYLIEDHGNDWRWTQWIVLITGAPLWIGAILMEETSKAWIITHKFASQKPTTISLATVAQVSIAKVKLAILRSAKLLVTDIVCFSLTLYTAYAYALTFSYFASVPYVFRKYYHFTPAQSSLTFISIAIGYFLAICMFMTIDKTIYARQVRAVAGGLPPPEHRLYAALVGSVFLPIGLFWSAWAAREGGNWAVLAASGIPFGIGAFSLFLSTISYLVDVYQAANAASALAANGTLRFALGAVFPLFTLQMYDQLGVHWAGTVFACLSVVLLPIPWLLMRYGHRLRARSRVLP